MDVMDALWRQAQKTLYITREQFIESLAGWVIDPQFSVDGALICAWLTKGPQLHFTTFGNAWQLTRADIRKRLLPLIEQFGHAETYTPKEDVRQHRFNRLVGFFETHRDSQNIHFRIERLRHA